jgi:hypothetical protein
VLISKTDFLDLILAVLNNDTIAVKRMELAHKRQDPIWENAEWIYVKDTEVCLKGLHKLHQDGKFNQFINIQQLILDANISLDEIDSDCIKSKIIDCRNNLMELYPNHAAN